ncbi:hypothetical protein GH5_07100 [Leishmania sp. Ghana 2012 LV757]|uniref:hypothetical protein n=1 Tax=Leishmania sp. Ghana 2012 LV757 TaxID=2803181 RepID=UPI001B50BEB1|nr:hypothetical protein GH5_07100 [Leishmania sp. Ghana 2012 LV757]
MASGTGSAGCTGSALLPNITAELRNEFYPLLSTLASCKSDISATYVLELFFTLARFDAVLKAKERQLFVSTAQQRITRLLQQLQKVHHMRQLLDENERFVGELAERCAALECLCAARDGDGDCHTNDGEGLGDVDTRQTVPTDQVQDDVVIERVDGEETAHSVSTTRAAGAAVARRHVLPSATYTGSTTAGQEVRWFSFDDNIDHIVGRTLTVQQSQRKAGCDGNVRSTSAATTEGGEVTTSPSTPSSLRQRHLQPPPPLQHQHSGLRSTTRPHHTGQAHSSATPSRARGTATTEQATGKATDEEVVRVSATSSIFTGAAAPTDVTPAVYSGVQHALQEHFRNNIQHTLTGSALTAPSSLNELAYQQLPQLRGATTRPSSRNREWVATTDGGVAEADINSTQQQQSLMLDPSLVSPGPAMYLFSSPYVPSLPHANTSTISVAAEASGASTSNALSIGAGGPFGPRMISGLSALCSPTTQEPVDTARVWERVFWRFLGGVTPTGDLAVLLTLLNRGHSAQTQGAATPAAATGGFGGGRQSSLGTGRGGASGKSGMANSAASAADAVGASRKSQAASPHAPQCGVQLLMEELKRSGTYSQLLPAAKASQMLSSSIAAGSGTVGVAGLADETVGSSSVTKGEREMRVGEVEQQQQHAREARRSPEAPSRVPAGGVPSSSSRVNNTSTVLLNLDDFAREEELRLHRDFWTHIPAILSALTEGVMYSGSHSTVYPDKESNNAPCVAISGFGEMAGLEACRGNSVCCDSVLLHGATNESGKRGDGELQDLGVSAGSADAAGGDEENVLAALHLPTAEALQLLPTFSPLLRNYTGAVKQLMRSAPEYARSTQNQHARALAVVAAQQQPVLLSPDCNDATATEGECPLEAKHSATATTVSTTSASVPLSNARVGQTRTVPQSFSAAHMQGLKDSHASPSGGDRRPGGGGDAAAAATGCASNPKSPAPAEIAERSLLTSGSCTEVRAVDVVVYALVTAIYVQCSMAVAMQQQQQQTCADASGCAMEMPTSTTVEAAATEVGRKTNLSEGARTPSGRCSPQMNWQCPGASSGASFAADGGTGTTSGNNYASMLTEEDRAPDKSPVNASLSYPGVGESSWWWNSSLSGGLRDGASGGVYSLSTSFALPPNTLFHPHLHSLHPMVPRSGGAGAGGAKGQIGNGSFRGLRSPHPPQAYVHHHQQQQQQSQPLRNSSFDTAYSATDVALSLLRMAHEMKSNGNGGGEREGRANSAGSDGPAVAGFGREFSFSLHIPYEDAHSLEFTTQDIVACANSFSWVSLPSIMKAELQHLREQLRDARGAVQRMEGQVRGELALLLFRLLSIVLDWLMPAVYVADPRVWLFYRKWCCDLYRVLCTDVVLLEEFRRLLNQSGVAVSGAAADASGLPRRRGESTREVHEANRAKTRSATSVPTLTPQRNPPLSPVTRMMQSPPQVQSPLPGALAAVSAVAAASSDSHDTSTGCVARDGTMVFMGRASRNPSVSCASPVADDASAATSASIEDVSSFVLPGSSLTVSVSYESPPLQPRVLSLLAQEEVDRRGEALAGTASLRAAQALLSDGGTVVPLLCPFLITRLVAATLRGIDADIAESLLWVVGQATAADGGAGACLDSGMEDEASGTLVDARRGRRGSSSAPQSRRASTVGTRGFRGDGKHRGTGGGGHADDVEGEGENAAHRRRRGYAARRTASGHRLHSHHQRSCARHHRSSSADARVGSGAASTAVSSHCAVDSEDDDGGYGDHWYGVLERRERGRLLPASLQSRFTAKTPGSGATGDVASPSPVFPHTTSRTPLSKLTSTGGSQHLPLPSQPSEGPTLVHHHRFRYPSVHGFADVAKLYLSTLDDAELFLSPHDPVYASLVLSAADLHLHNLRDTATAASLVNAYLVDVGEEHIQGPVWGELPAVLIRDEGSGGITSSLTVAGDSAGTPASARPTPAGRGFSVTRARQGNTQGPTSTVTASSNAAGVAAGPAAAASSQAAAPPLQQQPYVPMVIPSWNNEHEKEEFLTALGLLRQMQAFLAAVQTKPKSDVLKS